MTSYIPPTINTPIFDPTQFTDDNAITISEGDGRYLRFPISQGSETINGDLTITNEAFCTTIPSVNSSLTNKLYVDNAISGGLSGFVTIAGTETITGEKTFSNANTYINNTLTASTITATGDLILNPVGSIDCNGKTINMTGGEIHNSSLIHSQNNNNITIEGKGTGDVILKTDNVDRLIVNEIGQVSVPGVFSSSTSVGAPSISASTSMATPTITVTGGEAICATVPSGNTSLTNKLYVDGAISTAGSAFVTLSGTQSISGQKTFTNANTYIQNTLTTDTISGSAVGTAVSLYNEPTRTGRIDIGIGADARDIYIGNNTVIGSSTTRVRGCGVKIEANQEPLQIGGNGLLDMISVGPMTIQAGNTQNISIGNNMTNTGTFTLGGTTGGSAQYNIITGNSQTGNISIGSGSGTKTMVVGGSGTTLNLKGSNVALGNEVTGGNIDIGGALTTGNLTLGSGAGQVNISTNAINSTTVAICNNTSVNNTSIVTIGKNSALRINNDTGDVNLSTAETNAGGLTICTDATSTRTINIGRGNAISIANSATPTTTLTGSVRINDGGSASSQIGNNSAIPVNIIGDVRINAPTNTQSTSIGNSTGTITMIGNTSMTGDITVTQTTYPPSSTTAIGYTITKTFGPTNASDTTGTYSNIGSQALGTVKGVYFISCGFSLTASGNDTMNQKAVILSLTSGTSGVPVNAYGAWEYYDEINDSIGGAGGLRYIGTLCGVYTKTTTTNETLYLNGYGNTTGGVTISCEGNCSITRIA
jgi:hypothetical protein